MIEKNRLPEDDYMHGGGGGGGNPFGMMGVGNFYSMFGMATVYGGSAYASGAYSGGYSSGAGMGFGSAFSGRGWQQGNWIPQSTNIKHITGKDNVGLPGETRTITTGGYYQSVFNAGTYVGGNSGNLNKMNAQGGGGGVTFGQAQTWYQFGGGAPMNVNLNTIDFSRVSMSEIKGKLIEVNLDNPFKHMTNINDALVYGTLYLYQEKGNVFRAAHVSEINGRGDYYNFDVKWTSPKAWLFRNENTIVGGLINGIMPIGGSFIYVGGTPYPIYLNGTVKIKP